MTAVDGPALRGARVLVTRAAHQAKPLCDLIERQGGTALRFPAIEIAPPQDPAAARAVVARLTGFDLAVFVSPNAVAWGLDLVRALPGGWPGGLAVACIGAGSARALADRGLVAALVPERADSEGLLALPAMQQLAGKRVVLFRGAGGRELLAQTLRARGAHLEHVECYRRVAPTDARVLHELLVRAAVDIVTVTSADALRNLYTLAGAAGAPQLARLPFVVVSERLRGLGTELGLTGPIYLADSASDDAIVAALQAWHALGNTL